MKTVIYKNQSEFNARSDKSENGVSAGFATLHPEFEKRNQSNESCWNCSDCYGCSRCSDCSGCYLCSGCYDCSGCYLCSGCYDCSVCSGCSGCYDCSDCSRCSDCYVCTRCSRCTVCDGCYDSSRCSDQKNPKHADQSASESWFNVPVIPRLHQTVLAAVTQPDHKLEMHDWHTCKTTHCRAGWVVFLAGKKGTELEKASSTLFAAMQICKASSQIKVSPVRFFETAQVAMADIERCAKEEAALTETGAEK